MSNFTFKAKQRWTGKIVEVTAIDNYFGKNIYGFSAQNDKRVYKHDEFTQKYERL